jgi:hypothetical protein
MLNLPRGSAVTAQATPNNAGPGEAPPSSTNPSPTPTTGSQQRRVYWDKMVSFTDRGLDLDNRPPSPGNNNILLDRNAVNLFTYARSVLMSPWTEGSDPSSEACLTQTSTHPNNAAPATPGSKVCGITADGRVFFLRITQITSQGGEADAQLTVWDKAGP